MPLFHFWRNCFSNSTSVSLNHQDRSMIPAISTNSFASFGMSGGGKCTMRNASHLQQLFLGKIYADPLHALVRELWLNAIDSMIQAGRPEVPIEVSLPNLLSPVYRARDFGVGMTHDQFEAIYSDLGGSTKRSDAAVTGSLGLGSKSPLGYADLFNVSCYDGETVRHYLISKDVDGDMMWVPVSSCPSDEPQGVEVVVPIKTGDTAKVIHHYYKILSALNHPNMPQVAVPNVTGLSGARPEPTDWSDYPLTSPTVSFDASNSRTTSFRFFMGNIEYRANLEAMVANASKTWEDHRELVLATARELKIAVFAPMDASHGHCPVDFDAGRYNVQPTARSSDWVMSQLVEAAEKYWKAQVARLKAADGLLQRWSLLASLDKQYTAAIFKHLVARAGVTGDAQLLIPVSKSPLNLLLEAAGDQIGTGWLPRTYTSGGSDMRDVSQKMAGKRLANHAKTRARVDDFVSLTRQLRSSTASVLIIDEPNSWRQRYEADYDARLPVFTVAYEELVAGKLVRKPTAASAFNLRRYLESHGVQVTQVSELPVIERSRTVKLKRREKQFTLQQCYTVNSSMFNYPASVFRPYSGYGGDTDDRFLLLRVNGHRIETSPTSGWCEVSATWHEGITAAMATDLTRSDTQHYSDLLAYRLSGVKSSAMPDNCDDLFVYLREQYQWHLPLLECAALERHLRAALNNADVMEHIEGDTPFGEGRPRIQTPVNWMRSMMQIFGHRMRSHICRFEKVCVAFFGQEYIEKQDQWKAKNDPVCRQLAENFVKQYPLSPILPFGNFRDTVKTYPQMAHRLDRKDHLTAKDIPKLPILPESELLTKLVPDLPHFVSLTSSSYSGWLKRDQVCKTKVLTNS